MLFKKFHRVSSQAVFHRKMISSMPKVLITRSDIPEAGVTLLKTKCETEIWPHPYPIPRSEFLQRMKGKNGVYCMIHDKIDEEVLDAAGPDLKVIGTMSVGHDHINLQECKNRGISVGYTPDVLTDAVAELTVALLLSTARRLMEATKEVANGGWEKCVFGMSWMCGTTLAGSTVGIVGLGRIGFSIAERLIGFKVKNIIYSGNKEKLEAKKKLNANFVSFEMLLNKSDFVIVCCGLSKDTFKLFNLEAFKKMKKSAIFVNTSRGKVVNQEDLYTALTTGLIKAAGLDVMDPEPLPSDHKLTKLSNCLLLPHLGTATLETRRAMSVLTAKNILCKLEGKQMPCPLLE